MIDIALADVTPLVLALAREHVNFWWITLGLGVVVIIAVIVLLSLLVALVKDIDRNLLEAWETATKVAANTATTWMLQQAGSRADELAEEVAVHSQLLDQLGTRGGRR
jgi:Na+/H+ antiporter NhaD/arsenite permease-like protein